MADVIVLNEIDSAKQELSTQIGTTTNTGGTTTAGTLMSKLNALLTSWTSIRAGYVDAIKTNTDINNTASITGILSQKLSHIITSRKASLTGVGTTVFSGSPFPNSVSWELKYPAIIAKFIAPISGMYRLNMPTPNAGWVLKFGKSNNANVYTDYKANSYSFSNDIDPFYVYNQVSVGTILGATPKVNRSNTTGNLYEALSSVDLGIALGSCYTILGNTSTTVDFYCEAGEPVILALIGDSTGHSFIACNSTIVTYQNTTN